MALPSEFLTALLLWFVRAFISSLICLIIGIIGIKIITIMTTKISEFKTIKGDPIGTGLFVSGFLVFAGLVVYGSMVNPFFLSQSVVFSSYFNIQRLLVVSLSFFVSLFFGWLFYTVFARLTPFGMDLDDVNKSPIAVGIFLFGYEVFLGLIIYGSLMIPLG
ncbi:hypothetical protein A3K70_04520 [Candidatus Bathyarchaeota archaeon RBG_16_48_13]|nr:MAG: hypothetical protein A3K70_04520 [Candidatus Bathyarchaeota archaeon RBG_16_48_13]